MIKKRKIKLILFLFSLLGFLGFLINSEIYSDKRTKKINDLLENKQKNQLKKYLLPYQLISEQEKKIDQQKAFLTKIVPYLSELELHKKEISSDIGTTLTTINLQNKKILWKHKFNSGFYAGINNVFPGSGFIDFHGNNIVVLAARESSIDNQAKFKQIKNNINKFIGIEQFRKSHKVSIKDLLISEEKIYVSYTHEIKNDCWNTSLLFGEINYKNIEFKKLFSSVECVHETNNLDKEFEMLQSGGRIISFDENNILFSIGDYRSRHLAQNIDSVNGKIIKININDSDYKIISMGHRNPQGLHFEKEKNILLETEHGPMGGDEINLINLNGIKKGKIPNFGWPISSAGEHYGGISEKGNKIKYQKYPLYNSHEEYGFVEPLKSFVPSIGISEIVGIGPNIFVVSSLKDKSLIFFQLNNENELVMLDKIKVFERVRDLKFKNNNLYLFLEDSASLGIINIY